MLSGRPETHNGNGGEQPINREIFSTEQWPLSVTVYKLLQEMLIPIIDPSIASHSLDTILHANVKIIDVGPNPALPQRETFST